MTPKIYISFVPEDPASVVLAEQLRNSLSERELEMAPATNSIGYKESKSDYNQQLVQSKIVILIISNAYLQDLDAMTVLLSIMQKADWNECIFPLLMDDVHLTEAERRLYYIGYWEQRVKALEKKLRELLSVVSSKSVWEELDLLAIIRQMNDLITSRLADMNMLSVEEHKSTNFEALYQALDFRCREITRQTRLEVPSGFLQRLAELQETKELNANLILPVYKAMCSYDEEDELQHLLTRYKNAQKKNSPSKIANTWAKLKEEIRSAWPYPIGATLGELFSNNDDNMDRPTLIRLEQLILAYNRLAKVLTYILVSQVWEQQSESTNQPAPNMPSVLLQQLLQLTQYTALRFDYLALFIRLMDAMQTRQTEPFVVQFTHLHKLLKQGEGQELYDAYQYLEKVRLDLVYERVDVRKEDEMRRLCHETTHSLSLWMQACSFLVAYNMVSIREINVSRIRMSKPVYKHLTTRLFGVRQADLKPDDEPYNMADTHTDTHAVFIMKGDELTGDILNLSPLIVDENTFRGKGMLTKVMLYAYNHEDMVCYEHIDGEYPKTGSRLNILPGMRVAHKEPFEALKELYQHMEQDLSHSLPQTITKNAEA